MGKLIEFTEGRRSGRTTTAVALVHGFRAQGVSALYVAPTQERARFAVKFNGLPVDWVISGVRGICLCAAPVLVLDDVGDFPYDPEGGPVLVAMRRVETFQNGFVYAFY